MKKLKLVAILAMVSFIFFMGCKKDEYKAIVGVCPLVISTNPANNATGVPLNKIITATFNEKMNPATFTQTSFTIKAATALKESTAVSGTVSLTDSTATFIPSSTLLPNTTYTGTIKSTVRDLTGNFLQEDYVWTFNTDLSPTVILTSPVNNATGVVLNKIVTTSFNVPMDPLSITSTTFTIKQGTTAITGTIVYNGTTASFTPTIALTPNSVYTGTITTEAKNVAGTPLASNFVWTFTTDIVPTVISTDPANNATGVALDKTVAATFSVPMDPLTITSSTFTLKQGTTSVVGAVSYSGATALFNPSVDLLPGTLYTATITTGAKNVGGIPLANNYVWTFTTAVAIVPPTVISTDPLNNAIDVVLNKTVAAIFSVPMDELTITSSTFTLKQGTTSVTGVVSYNGATALFNPSVDLLPGILYTATITTGAKNLDGTALANNYVWTFTTDLAPTVISTDPLNNATNVVLDKTVEATFSVPMDELTITSSSFTLKQGTTSVTGVVSYSGSKAFFNPTVDLLPGLVYTATITTGAMNLNGTAMANNYVWTFTTAVAIVPPTVISTDPLNNAIDVVLDKTVAATFSVPMDSLTITSATFTLKQGTTSVIGIVSYSGSTAFLKPTVDLLPGTLYTATITTGAKNVAGTAMANNYVWNFTTELISPKVILTDPIDNATDVVRYKRLAATFNMRMNSYFITSSTFTLKQGTTLISGLVYYASSVAYFQPVDLLLPSTTYTATIKAGVKNLAGTPLENDYVWTFTTESIDPRVISTDPLNNATNVEVNKTVEATFNQRMDSLTITSSTFTLKQGTTPVDGLVSYSGSTAFFNPSVDLLPNTLYTATITTGAKNLTGTPLNYDYIWSFTTFTQYTLNVNAINGTVEKNPDQTAYNPGTLVELTAIPASGYEFTSWSGDISGILNPKEILMNANKNITANFTLIGGSCTMLVDLKSSGNYVILAETGISAAGVTSVTGDMGISPYAATYITGFGLILPAGGKFSTSSYVTGNIYAPGYALPTPGNLTTAITDMYDAHTAAYGLVVPAPVVNLEAGNLNGQTLPSGIHKWTSGVSITNEITLDGGSDDCAQFVLQIAGQLTVANNTIIKLINGAQAKNIFWVISGPGAVLGTNVTFKGNILSSTLISVNTGTTVTGRLLAQSAVTLELNTHIVFPY